MEVCVTKIMSGSVESKEERFRYARAETRSRS